jgi:hypothetical protein
MKTRKTLSLLVVLAMLISLVSFPAFADDDIFEIPLDKFRFTADNSYREFVVDNDAFAMQTLAAFGTYKYFVIKIDGDEAWGLIFNSGTTNWNQIVPSNVAGTDYWYTELASYGNHTGTWFNVVIGIESDVDLLGVWFADTLPPWGDDDDDDDCDGCCDDDDDDDDDDDATVIEYTDVANVRAVDMIDVNLVTEKGIFQGSGGRFRPFDTITGAEFLAVLSRLAESGVVNGNPWYEPFLEWGEEFGIVDADDVDIDAPLGRTDMALWFYRYIVADDAELAELKSAPAFTDIGGLDDETVEAIEALYTWGIIEGSTPGVVFGTAALERVRVANVVSRYLRALDGELEVGEDPIDDDPDDEPGDDDKYLINIDFRTEISIVPLPTDGTDREFELNDFSMTFWDWSVGTGRWTQEIGVGYVFTNFEWSNWGFVGMGLSLYGFEDGKTYGVEVGTSLTNGSFIADDLATGVTVGDGIVSGTVIFNTGEDRGENGFNIAHPGGGSAVAAMTVTYVKIWIVD